MGQNCRQCNGKNHFAKPCYFKKEKKVHNVENVSDTESEPDYSEFFVDSVDTDEKSEKYKLSIKTNGKYMNYKLDTGSEVNVLSMKDFKTLKKRPKIHKSKIRLTSYSGDKIPVHGSCMMNIDYKGKKTNFHFLIAENNVIPILGEKAPDKLGLIKGVFTIAEEEQDSNVENNYFKCEEASTQEIVKQYKDVFEGLGCLPGEHRIEVNERVRPVVTPCRKVAFKIRDKLKLELDRMEEHLVICKENEPTELVSAITILNTWTPQSFQ